jgi:hypothetical protein
VLTWALLLLPLLQTPCLSTADGQKVQSTAAIARYGECYRFNGFSYTAIFAVEATRPDVLSCFATCSCIPGCQPAALPPGRSTQGEQHSCTYGNETLTAGLSFVHPSVWIDKADTHCTSDQGSGSSHKTVFSWVVFVLRLTLPARPPACSCCRLQWTSGLMLQQRWRSHQQPGCHPLGVQPVRRCVSGGRGCQNNTSAVIPHSSPPVSLIVTLSTAVDLR